LPLKAAPSTKLRNILVNELVNEYEEINDEVVYNYIKHLLTILTGVYVFN